MPQINHRAILITGASSGIGEACVRHFDRPGWRVFGTVRSEHDADAMRAKCSERVTPILLDVTDAAMISTAADLLTDQLAETGLYGLVNNAGISIGGPFEVVPLDQFRRQFEVNVFGQIALTQALMPLLRRAKGRIVFIGSIAGRSSFPFSSPYNMSKWALEALVDSLRVELRPFGVCVAIVEPGSIDTPIWNKNAEKGTELMGALTEHYAAYEKPYRGVQSISKRAAKMGIPPAQVARAIDHALTSHWPRSRYVVGADARLMLLVEALPDWLRDWLMGSMLNWNSG